MMHFEHVTSGSRKDGILEVVHKVMIQKQLSTIDRRNLCSVLVLYCRNDQTVNKNTTGAIDRSAITEQGVWRAFNRFLGKYYNLLVSH